MMTIGKVIHALALKLWGLNRSITGDGVRKSLEIISEILPDLTIHEIPSGTRFFDWTVPQEWRVNDAYIIDPKGRRICDFKINNLHLVGYSVAVNLKMTLGELQNNLHSLPDQPMAIPYVTSYYQKRWGFCISQIERDALIDGEYHVVIDSELFDGFLTYGELFIRGQLESEVLLSTNICHPSMANNELSGLTVTTYLAKWVSENTTRKYSYRVVFVPETIGAIAFIHKNLDKLKSKVVAGFNVACVGDCRDYSYLPSRAGNTLSDEVAKHVLTYLCESYKSYKWTDRGSDERQYCSPGVDLPIASIMRTKYGEFAEYHTSLDDLVNVVTPTGLEGGYKAIVTALEAIEKNCYPKMKFCCEPQLGKRGLYPTLSTKTSGAEVKLMMDLISWSDGTRSLLDIASLCECPVWYLYPIVENLYRHDLLELFESSFGS